MSGPTGKPVRVRRGPATVNGAARGRGRVHTSHGRPVRTAARGGGGRATEGARAPGGRPPRPPRGARSPAGGGGAGAPGTADGLLSSEKRAEGGRWADGGGP